MFPPYNPTLLMKTETADKAGPDLAKTIDLIQKPLTDDAMQELDARVDLDKKEPGRGRQGVPDGDRPGQVSALRPARAARAARAGSPARSGSRAARSSSSWSSVSTPSATTPRSAARPMRQRRLDDPPVAFARGAGDEAAVELDARSAAAARAGSGRSSRCRSRRGRPAGRARASASRPAIAASPPSIRVVSVISSAIRSAATPVAAIVRDDPLGEAGLAELARGDVDADADALRERPASMQARRRTQSPIAEISRASCSATGRKRPGREQALLGVLPAHERLDGDDAQRVELPDRLVVRAAARRARSRAAGRPRSSAGRAGGRSIARSKTSKAPPPRALTRCMAASAPWTRSAPPWPRSSIAIPIAAVTWMPSRSAPPSARASRCGERGGLALVLALGEHRELVAAEARERLRDVERPGAGGWRPRSAPRRRRRGRACR